MSPDKMHRDLCFYCSKRTYANSEVIQCLHCCCFSHVKCVKKLTMTNEVNSFAKYLCHKCIIDSLPFLHLNDDDFYSSRFELQLESCSFPLDQLNNLSFHPFRDDNTLKSKASFLDNFCDPDEQGFKGTDAMSNNCKYFTEDSFQKIVNKNNFDFSLVHLNIQSLRKHFDDRP